MWARRKISVVESQPGQWCGTAIILVTVMSACAFLLSDSALPLLALANLPMLIQGSRLGSLKGILVVFALQLLMTSLFYLLLYGWQSLPQAALVVFRLLLALIPGWWLSARFAPEQLGSSLARVLPSKWAFVLAATLSLLPHIQREAMEIYRLQCLRGAPITKRALRNPKNWLELGPCLLFPLLIELMKLSRQQALAAKSRHFGTHPKPTHWQAPEDL
ncbi:energy-coupling factor transporter transmembrane protein EcfT [Shewanella corallii]|uniref:Energy-coupling factor transporter transmembrane protein EcfT n=1 Tax=Shewanella corallii TaxID=560080 RepID=A0ABT0N9G9_9GAMM|nr:energy-coupling factor transporter transmembrane component T [Shewanella corallii]MCL2915114.1 energy-coupling factor transporter transmembrane protein EcfT [Shewanella corallii]